MAYTEAQMRAALQAEIEAAAPLAVVFPWWALGHDPNEWPGILKSPADSDRVHGYVITRRRTFGERENPNCVRRFFTYQIRGLRWYDETGNEDANSDLAYNAELDAIGARFANKSSLPAPLKRIAEESELNFDVDLNVFGGELLHRSVGEITFEQC